MSTAIVRDNVQPTPTKLTTGPTQEAQSMRQAIDAPNKQPGGVTGIVTLEPGYWLKPEIGAKQNSMTAAQVPGPLPRLVEPKNEHEPAVLALVDMLNGRHQEAIKHLSAYDNAKQELLLRLMPVFVTLVKKRISDLTTEEADVLGRQFVSLLDELRPRRELVVSRMCYCKEVNGYASVIALSDQHQFLAGTADRVGEQVKLYVELKNFASEPTKEGEFVTKLSCSLELRDAQKKVVMERRFEGNETTLRRSTRLNDLYSLYGFYVPNLPAGRYDLVLRIADETNPQQRRLAEKSLVFNVTPVANSAPLR